MPEDVRHCTAVLLLCRGNMSVYTDLPKIKTEYVSEDIPDIDYGNSIHLDIETSGLNPSDDELWVINIGYDPLEDGTYQKSIICRVPEEVSCPPVLRKLLLNSDIVKYVHNAIFDTAWIVVKWGIKAKNVRCTKIIAKLSGGRQNSYQKLVKLVTGLYLPKGAITLSPWNKPFKEWSQEMRNYCAYDVAFGYKIYKYFDDILSDKDRRKYDSISNSWDTVLELVSQIDYRSLRLL